MMIINTVCPGSSDPTLNIKGGGGAGATSPSPKISKRKITKKKS